MDYDIVAAVVAGLVATGVMTAMMYMGRAMMPAQMPMNILYMMGSMMSRSSGPLYLMGFMMHFGMGVIFAIVHTALYQAFGLESELLVWGLLFGAVHWVVASMGMGMMGSMHPRIRDGELAAPGAFLKNYPMMSVVGVFMLHLIFGLIVGSVYEALL
jgi:hypothetical protein